MFLKRNRGEKAGSPTWRSVLGEKWEVGKWGGSGHGMLRDLGPSAETGERSTGGSKRVTVRYQTWLKAWIWPRNKPQYPEPRWAAIYPVLPMARASSSAVPWFSALCSEPAPPHVPQAPWAVFCSREGSKGSSLLLWFPLSPFVPAFCPAYPPSLQISAFCPSGPACPQHPRALRAMESCSSVPTELPAVTEDLFSQAGSPKPGLLTETLRQRLQNESSAFGLAPRGPRF